MYSLSLLTFFALIYLTSAHFLLNYPPTLGFDDDTEGESPCGAADITFSDNDTTIPIGGFPVALQSEHPEAAWLYSATTDQQAPFNWTNILPVVNQAGLGDFCLSALTLPDTFANKTGLIQVIQDAADGKLFQCSAVKFVTGTNTSVSKSSCTNGTGVTGSLTTMSNFTSTGSAAPTMSSGLAAQAPAGSIFAIGFGFIFLGVATL